MAKGKGKPKLTVVSTIGPTAEQAKRHEYETLESKDSRFAKIEKTYRRIPVYVTMHKQKRIPDELMQAFGWYRDRWDTSLHSPLRDSLGKHQPHGGGSYERFRARVIDALADVEYAEAGVPPFLRPTLRSVVLDDLTATEIARARWGKFEPGQERIDRIVAELVLGGLKLMEQVSHIVQNGLAYPSRKR